MTIDPGNNNKNELRKFISEVEAFARMWKGVTKGVLESRLNLDSNHQSYFMKSLFNSLLIISSFLYSCAPQPDSKNEVNDSELTEFSSQYRYLPTEKFRSQQVGDTFKIFKAVPRGYHPDSARRYPLILLLDGNAFFESVVTEMKFNSFVGVVPNAIVVGIGYNDLYTMDSLRSRDYTYPEALMEYEMTLSGGAKKMKSFIDSELLPSLQKGMAVDPNRVVLCGHSLGGYFVLFYTLQSLEDGRSPISGFVAASPSLHYNNRFLFDWMNRIGQITPTSVMKLYVSMGSGDMSDSLSTGILNDWEATVRRQHLSGFTTKAVEYTNFDHLDAAVPGFLKGIEFVLPNPSQD